ncbi:hypothetical protein NPX13_g2483 [Xylaria arbuscula]|uniref:Uncharacterized protein n=1 Tax=Xylaria arbuscula TaxID=114810 RepID=A0A9W8NJ38_9PEZI|nr:hypothetical protein NPX13_g2483 [Xylaria arbuscula]
MCEPRSASERSHSGATWQALRCAARGPADATWVPILAADRSTANKLRAWHGGTTISKLAGKVVCPVLEAGGCARAAVSNAVHVISVHFAVSLASGPNRRRRGSAVKWAVCLPYVGSRSFSGDLHEDQDSANQGFRVRLTLIKGSIYLGSVNEITLVGLGGEVSVSGRVSQCGPVLDSRDGEQLLPGPQNPQGPCARELRDLFQRYSSKTEDTVPVTQNTSLAMKGMIGAGQGHPGAEPTAGLKYPEVSWVNIPRRRNSTAL